MSAHVGLRDKAEQTRGRTHSSQQPPILVARRKIAPVKAEGVIGVVGTLIVVVIIAMSAFFVLKYML
jgi:hypothetical protein